MKTIDTKIKYLEMLQAVISRMNANSFAVKNWFMVSVGGLTAIFFKDGKIELLGLALVMTLAFYMYDVFYLWLERCYRQKYDKALKDESDLFDMDICDIKKGTSMGSVMNSPSLTIYKIAGIILIILVIGKMVCIK